MRAMVSADDMTSFSSRKVMLAFLKCPMRKAVKNNRIGAHHIREDVSKKIKPY